VCTSFMCSHNLRLIIIHDTNTLLAFQISLRCHVRGLKWVAVVEKSELKDFIIISKSFLKFIPILREFILFMSLKKINI
jgi:hypothetical protein